MQSVQEKRCFARRPSTKLTMVSLLLLGSTASISQASTYVRGLNVASSDAIIVVKKTSVFNQCNPNFPYKRSDDVEYPIGKHPYKNNNGEYFIGVDCVFESKAPNNFTITYAVLLDNKGIKESFYGKKVEKEVLPVNAPEDENDYYDFIAVDGRNLSYQEWWNTGNQNRDKAIAQLPKSAWQTLTIDVKGTLAKYKNKTPEGQPVGLSVPLGMGIVYPSLFPSLKDRTLYLDINIDSKGAVQIKEIYNWKNKLSDNPYA